MCQCYEVSHETQVNENIKKYWLSIVHTRSIRGCGFVFLWRHVLLRQQQVSRLFCFSFPTSSDLDNKVHMFIRDMPSQAGRINFILQWKRYSIQVTVEILSPNALLQVRYLMHNNVHFFNSGCRSKGMTSSYSQWTQDWMHFKYPFRRIVVFMRTAMNSTSLDPREEREFDLQLFVAYLTLIMIFVAVIVRSVLCT